MASYYWSVQCGKFGTFPEPLTKQRTLSRLNVLDDGNLEEGEQIQIDEGEINRKISGIFGDDDINPTPEEDWSNDYAADAEIMEYCFHE